MSLYNKYPQSWLDDKHPNLKIVMDACQLIFDRISAEIELAKLGLSVNKASNWYLDLHGEDLKVYRVPGETDENYRVRILDEMLRRRNTVSAIITAINSIQTGNTTEVYEPWKNLFKIGESKLSGDDKIIDYEYWNYHVTEVLSTAKSELVEKVLQKIIAAGKTLYVTKKVSNLVAYQETRDMYLVISQEITGLSTYKGLSDHGYSAYLINDGVFRHKRPTTLVSTMTIMSEETFNDAAEFNEIQTIYQIKNEIQGVDY